MLPAIFNVKDIMRLNKFVATVPIIDPSFNEVIIAEPMPIEAKTTLEPADFEAVTEIVTEIVLEPSIE